MPRNKPQDGDEILEADRKKVAIPAEADQAMAVARDCLGSALVAAYLHGSAVAGGLRPDSDVDILLVIDRPIADKTRRRFLSELMRISGHPKNTDPRRPLEVIVFNTADLANMPYPARSEFVYGEWLRDAFEAGSVPQPETDPEFTVLLAQTRQAALTLAGPQPHHLLPTIPDHDLRRAIGDARKRLVATLDGDERNVLLTLARMWCTLETGKIVPKDVAAEWAMPRLSGIAATLMDHARLAYLGLVEDDWNTRRSDVEMVAGDLSDRVATLV